MAKYDVFISYSRKDSEFAEKVCAVFDAYKKFYKFEYFFDREEIKSANEYLERIADAITESKALLFLASKNSYSSPFCSKELLFANQYNVTIHRYCLDNSQPPPKINLLLIDQHFLEASTCTIEKMVREVLSNALKQDIRPLVELEGMPPVATKKNINRKNIIRSLCLGILLFIAILGGYKGYHLLMRDMLTYAPYKVGDYYNDGTKEGVVFEVSADGCRGKIVSMKQSIFNLKWSKSQEHHISSNTRSLGAYIMKLVRNERDWESNYPAFKWCADLGLGWYLPTVEELDMFICDVAALNDINRTLKRKGGVELRGRYWSSTEDDNDGSSALFVDVTTGFTAYNPKKYKNYVRAVATF